MNPRVAMAAMFAASAARRAAPGTAFAPARRTMSPRRCLSGTCCGWTQTRRMHHSNRGKRRHHHRSALSWTSAVELDAAGGDASCNSQSPRGCVEEVISFLDVDGIQWRRLSHRELRCVLQRYYAWKDAQINATATSDRVEEMVTLLDDRTILAVTAKNDTDIQSHDNQSSNLQPYSFLLHLCPAQNLQSMQAMHQKHQPSASVSQTVAAYAWLNAHLTNAFFNYDPSNQHLVNENMSGKPLTSVVHLHQDVWGRSSDIVQSRLRSKCGMFQRRVYARQTIAKRIHKAQYLHFLEENHLWGATGAKYGYGLFLKRRKNDNENGQGSDAGHLVAVATFSSKRKVSRATHKFHSFELLRFCTALDTTVVGGLTKLVATFVRDMKSNQNSNVDGGVEMDLITSIDRDFGCNTWPHFEQMEVMDPVPMFVGDDGLRRHAVGAGLSPLEIGGGTGPLTTSTLLRSGLPHSLLQQLDQHEIADEDSPWQIAAEAGFHPVFDAGVERLIMLVGGDETGQISLSELWENSTPRYVKEHYSPNAGIESMLRCIRRGRTHQIQ